MQKVQMFHVARVRVRGLNGIQQEERLRVCDSDSVSHAGKEYKAGDDGWIEVPFDVYESLKRVQIKHQSGNGYMKWCTPADVDETIKLGLADRVPQPREPARRAAKASAQTA